MVIAVWLAIGVRALLLLNPSIPEVQQQDYVSNTNFKLNTKIDTFSIHTTNRDPFLGTLLKVETSKKKTMKSKVIEWKPILYQGLIKQDNTKQKIFIVSINGKQYLLKKGQTKDSTTLIYGNSKTITLRYKNQSKSFNLKK